MQHSNMLLCWYDCRVVFCDEGGREWVGCMAVLRRQCAGACLVAAVVQQCSRASYQVQAKMRLCWCMQRRMCLCWDMQTKMHICRHMQTRMSAVIVLADFLPAVSRALMTISLLALADKIELEYAWHACLPAELGLLRCAASLQHRAYRQAHVADAEHPGCVHHGNDPRRAFPV